MEGEGEGNGLPSSAAPIAAAAASSSADPANAGSLVPQPSDTTGEEGDPTTAVPLPAPEDQGSGLPTTSPRASEEPGGEGLPTAPAASTEETEVMDGGGIGSDVGEFPTTSPRASEEPGGNGLPTSDADAAAEMTEAMWLEALEISLEGAAGSADAGFDNRVTVSCRSAKR